MNRLNVFFSTGLIFLLSSHPYLACADILPVADKFSRHCWAWIGPYAGPSKANQGYRMNLGFVIGEKSVAVIDSGYTEAMAREMLQQIRTITPLPIHYVINTNSQPHRFMGNSAFKQQGATIIAAKDAVPRMKDNAPQYAATIERILELKKNSINLPAIADKQISSVLNLDLGGVNLQVIPVGHAHTAGSLIVNVTTDNLVFSGDVLYSGRLLSILPASNISGWLKAYEMLRSYEDSLFVPGHGKAAKLSAFEHSTYEYLFQVQKYMDTSVENMLDIQDAINNFDDSSWANLENYSLLARRNAHQAYLQSEAAGF